MWWCLQGKAEPRSCRHWELVVWPQQNTSYSPFPCCLLCPCFDASHLCTTHQASSAPAAVRPVQMGECAPSSLGSPKFCAPWLLGKSRQSSHGPLERSTEAGAQEVSYMLQLCSVFMLLHPASPWWRPHLSWCQRECLLWGMTQSHLNHSKSEDSPQVPGGMCWEEDTNPGHLCGLA